MKRITKEDLNVFKTICDIYKLTDEFIDSFNDLANKLNLNNPLEIYSLFCYLMECGYLSFNKYYKYDTDKSEKYLDLYHNGYLVIVGCGVCRHTAPLLRDIYLSRDINSHTIPVYARNTNEIRVSRSPYSTYTKELLDKFINDNLNNNKSAERKLRKEIEKLDDNYIKHIVINISEVENISLQGEIFGNHVICAVEDDGYVYYVDPTNYSVFKRNKNKLESTSLNTSIKPLGLYWHLPHEPLKEINETNKFLKSDFDIISKEEENKLISDTERVCESNIDLFDRFYKQNEKLYEEVFDKARVLKKK